jgi:prepilin-type N-terminal cleavage/methylation domain-containing protein
MKYAKDFKGYTLVELMIVIALITIMATIAFPAWQKYVKNTNLKDVTRQIMTDIMETRQRTITENINTYQMTFNSGNNTYSLSRSDTGVTLWTKKLSDLGNGISLSYASLGGGNIIQFQKRGTMTPGEIGVKNTLGSYAKIKVQILGRADVYYYLQK